MAEFVEILSPSAKKDLESANAELLTMISNMDKLGQKVKGVSTPSGGDSALKTLTAEYQKQEKVIQSLQSQLQSLQSQLEKLNAVRSTTQKQTTQEMVNNQVLRRNAIEYAKANSTLAGAYANLSAKVSMASRKYQDLIARGRLAEQTQRQYNKELSKAQSEFQKLQNKVLSADKAVGKWSRTGERSIGFLKNMIGAFGIAGGVTLFATITKDIFNTTKEIQSLDLALKQVTGTNKIFSESQAFLSRISEQYGIEINGLTKQFTQFYVSAKDKLSGKEIQGIFESIAKSAGFMGLSVEAQDRAFVALNQMMSKGTVSAEELKGQLGEALPGAFGIMAKAMGTTEQGLAKLMKDGNVLASEVLPKFAKELEKAYGIENKDRVESLVAAQTRLSNSWTEFIRNISSGESVITKFFTKMIGYLNTALNTVNRWTISSVDLYKKSISYAYTEELKKQNDEYSKMAENEKKLISDTRNFYAKKRILSLKEEIKALADRNEILRKEVRVTPLGNVYSYENERERKKNTLEMERLSYILYKNKAILDASNQVLDVNTKTYKTNTDSINKNIESRKEETKVLIEQQDIAGLSLIERLEREKAKLELEQKQISKNNIEWRMYQKLIDGVQKSIEQLTDTHDYLGDSGKNAADSLSKLGEQMRNEEEATRLLKEQMNDFLRTFSESFASEQGFTMLFDVLSGKIKGFGEDFKTTFVASMEIAQEAFNYINRLSDQKYEKAFENLEKEKNIAIQFAGDSTSAKEEIERQYEERRKQLERQKAQQEKQKAIFNIIIDTAQAVVGALAEQNYAGAVLFGVLGAAQLAIVNSQQPPQYEHGTDNHIGGDMIINDQKGNSYKELVQTPDGKKRIYEGRNVKVNAPKGTKVFTATETAMMFDNNLNNILSSNSIQPNVIIQNNGVTYQEMDSIMNKHFANIQTNVTTFDKQGFNTHILKAGQKNLQLQNRVSFKGYSV